MKKSVLIKRNLENFLKNRAFSIYGYPNYAIIIKNKKDLVMFFYPHGELHFEIEGKFQIIKGTGPWNVESIVKSADDVSKIHNELYGTKWCVLAIIHGQPIHTPDAAQLLVETVIQDKKNGRIASALVLDESDNPNFGRHHIAQIYKEAGEKFDFFNDINNAKKWLYNQLNACE